MSRLRVLLLPLLAATLVAGCDEKFPDDSKVLAEVNGESITQNDYDVYVQLRAGQQQGPTPDEGTVLNEMIDRVLLAQKGTELGFDKEAAVHFRLKRIRENLLAQQVFQNKLQDVTFSDDEVKQRFTEELEKAHKTEYKLRHILVNTEDEAKGIKQELAAGKKFDQLAKAKSIDPGSKDTGGALGDWVNQGSGLATEFFDAASTLKKGEVSEPVKTEFGWHVIKIDDTRPLELPTVEQFMSSPGGPANMRRRMQEEKIQEFLKQLRDQSKIVKN